MSIFTQVPATERGASSSPSDTAQAEFARTDRRRFARVTRARPLDSCAELVDSDSENPAARSSASGSPADGDRRARAVPALARWFGDTRARLHFDSRSRGMLSIVMLFVAVAAMVTAWYSWPKADQPPATVAVSSETDTDGERVGLFVSVVGDVVNPGMVEVPSGSRVADAIAAAGGLDPEVESAGYLNLARKVEDGELIVVDADDGEEPDQEDPDSDEPSDDDKAGDDNAGAGIVNLNQATAAELDTLPGIGPVMAERIVAYRDEHGGFDSVDQLQDVAGIGPATMERIRDLVTV